MNIIRCQKEEKPVTKFVIRLLRQEFVPYNFNFERNIMFKSLKNILGISLMIGFVSVWAGPEDPIKVGKITADFQKQRSILKLSCELKFVHPWHINSDTLEQEYLIATRILLPDTSKGYSVKREFPKPTIIKLFGEKMEVFAKDVFFKEFYYLNSKESFPLTLKLQYQACSDKICLPPKFHEITVKKDSAGKFSVSL